MAINLNPGADATIATAAARAGMAGVPVDLSTTFQGMATGYQLGMDKMGEGLAVAAKQGALAVDGAVKAAKERKEFYGEDIMGEARGNLKSLVQGGFDIFKKRTRNEDGTFTAWTDEEIEEKTATAKDNWKRHKELTFRTFRELRDGTTGLENLLSGDAYNAEELAENPGKALIAQCILLKGDKIPEGETNAGCYMKMEQNEAGDGYVINIYGPNGEIVTGHEGGKPTYGGTDSISTPTETRNMGEANAAVDRLNDFVGSTEDRYRENRGEMPKETNKKMQRLLQEAGYNIDYTNAKGELVTGEDAVDGEWGGATTTAWNQYIGNLNKAMRDDDGKISYLGGQHPIHEQIKKERGEVAKGLWGQISAQGKPQLSITTKDVAGLVVPHNVENVVALNTIDQNNITNGTNGLEFREDEVRNEIRAIVNSPEALRDMMHSSLGDMQSSYAKQLGQPNLVTAEMWAGINNMFGDSMSELDTNDTPGLDAGDFTGSDAANMAILRKAMLDPKNPAAKDLFIDWYANGVKKSHQAGLDRYNAKQKTTTSTTTDPGDDTLIETKQTDGSTTYVRQSTMNNNATAFKSIETGNYASNSFTGWNNETYSFEKDQWFVKDTDDDGKTIKMPIPRQSIINQLKFGSQPNVMNYIGGSLETQEVGMMKGSNDIYFQSQTGKGSANMGDRRSWARDKNGNWLKDGKIALWFDKTRGENGAWLGQKVEGMPELAASKKLAEFLEKTIDPLSPN